MNAKPTTLLELYDLVVQLAGRGRLAEAEGQPERVVALRQLAVKGVTQYLAAHPADLPEWKRLLGLLAPRALPPIQIDPRPTRGLVQ